jgi:hypothetical protein
MSVINKPDTSKRKHYNASYIKTVGVPHGFQHAVMSASVEGNAPESYADQTFTLTDKAFNRVKLGGGAKHPELRTGLRSKSRFNLIFTVEGAAEGLEQVVNVHTYPTDNYAQCDMSEELKTYVGPETAIVQIYPKTGDMDIMAFPYKFYRAGLIRPFIKRLEATTSFDYDDSFMLGDVRFAVTQIQGSTISFSCVKQRL